MLLAVLVSTVELSTINSDEDPELKIPPPSEAVFEVIIAPPSIVAVPLLLIPPPNVAELLPTVESSTMRVRFKALKIPPPEKAEFEVIIVPS